jgi:hypothetical protein
MPPDLPFFGGCTLGQQKLDGRERLDALVVLKLGEAMEPRGVALLTSGNWHTLYTWFGDEPTGSIPMDFPGRGAAWLARLHGVQEVAGSNPVAPIFCGGAAKNQRVDGRK